jgi:hypothetical protein
MGEPPPLTKDAACILYDDAEKKFTLKNVSSQQIWYDMGSRVFELQLPSGEWHHTFINDCGSGREWKPLASGASVALSAGFGQGFLPVGELVVLRTTSRVLAEFAKQNGAVDHLPVRVSINVKGNPQPGPADATLTSPEIARP